MFPHYALFLVVFIIFASKCSVSQSANVLSMFTTPEKSQLIVFMAVANILIERGHNVTVITTIAIPPELKSKKPFNHILLEQSADTKKTLYDIRMSIATDQSSKIECMINMIMAFNLFATLQRDALEQKKFKRFLQEDNHFDLMLLGYFHNDYLVGVAAHYGCPIAVISLGAPYGPISRMVGNPEETTYVQFPLFGRIQPMSFTDRLLNFLWAAVEPFLHIFANRRMESLYNRLFTADFYPKYSEVITNISLVLCNKHFSELPVQPLVPALIEIGGIQINEQPDPLPEDIQTFLDSATNGVVLYCVGLKIHGSYLLPDKVKIVFKVLSKLKQRVLWNWDKLEAPQKIASNILFTRWLHHQNVLSHPNIKAYITDGRYSAVFAAQYHGIPAIGIPIYADQPYNVEDMINKGFGVSVDVNTLSEQSLKEALVKILDNPYYTQKVKHFSDIYRDRPTTARETAAFWLEYVIRHRGAPHMQSPLVHMDFVQRWSIDVMIVLLAFVYAFVKLTKFVVFLVRRSLDFNTERARCTKYKHL